LLTQCNAIQPQIAQGIFNTTSFTNPVNLGIARVIVRCICYASFSSSFSFSNDVVLLVCTFAHVARLQGLPCLVTSRCISRLLPIHICKQLHRQPPLTTSTQCRRLTGASTVLLKHSLTTVCLNRPYLTFVDHFSALSYCHDAQQTCLVRSSRVVISQTSTEFLVWLGADTRMLRIALVCQTSFFDLDVLLSILSCLVRVYFGDQYFISFWLAGRWYLSGSPAKRCIVQLRHHHRKQLWICGMFG
jgi:hypothetical protein